MDFYEVVRTRRSVRSYSDRPIPSDVLARVLDAARLAPSGRNRQPWKFIVVRSQEVKEKLVPLCNGQRFIAEAPVVIVACGRDIKYNRGGYMGRYSMLVDVSIAFTHLILAARAEGLGTCWIGAFDNEGIKELLDIPGEWDVVVLTPLGYPRDPEAFRETRSRKPLDEIVSEDRFEQR